MLVATAGSAAAQVADAGGPASAQQGPWTAEVSVAMRIFETPAIPSPDGSMFFFVVMHGDISCDCNVYELRAFRTADVQAALRASAPTDVPLSPLSVIERRSSNHSLSPFYTPHWDPDGRSIVFNGLDVGMVRQLYRFTPATGRVAALTNFASGVSPYAQIVGDHVVSTKIESMPDAPPGRARPRYHIQYPMHPVTERDVLRPVDDAQELAGKGQVTRISVFGRSPITLTESYSNSASFSLSPANNNLFLSARWFATYASMLVPHAWRQYDRVAASSPGSQIDDLEQFMLIDIGRRTERPLIDAPLGTATNIGAAAADSVSPAALWAKDGRHVVLVNTALPLGTVDDVERCRMAYVVGYDISSGRWTVIEPLQFVDPSTGSNVNVVDVRWLVPGEELLIRHTTNGTASSSRIYHLENGAWMRRDADPATSDALSPAVTGRLPEGFTVSIREDQNTPPTMIATSNQREVRLTAPDPALAGVRLIEQQQVEWTGPDGVRRTGGLLLPVSQAGSPPPLVIDAYTYDPERFSPDGVSGTNTYSAQSLVARGIAVLTITTPASRPEWHDRIVADPSVNGPAFAADVDAAADELARRGLIDRRRVGLVGFSRAGWETYFAVTHPGRIPPAAAVVDDALQTTYGALATEVAAGLPDFSVYNGGSFWNAREAWRENENTFNMDRVMTPMLFGQHNMWGVPLGVPTLGAFRMSRRPLDYLVVSHGFHGLEMPLERLASQNATIDWMMFWLLGVEPPSYAYDPERPARWRQLRDDWELQKAWEAAGNPFGSAPSLDFRLAHSPSRATSH